MVLSPFYQAKICPTGKILPLWANRTPLRDQEVADFHAALGSRVISNTELGHPNLGSDRLGSPLWFSKGNHRGNDEKAVNHILSHYGAIPTPALGKARADVIDFEKWEPPMTRRGPNQGGTRC
jgi:hypothetical protein